MFKRNKSASQSDSISPDLLRVVEHARKYILLQVSAFERTSLAQVPFYGRSEDMMVGAYAWGFLDGHQQIRQDDLNWAGPEKRCEALALMAIEVSRALFGLKRHARLVERLPMLTLGCWPNGLELDDKLRAVVELGGTDGMACANGRESRWTMGGLHYFLSKQVEPKWPGFAQAGGAA